MSPPLFLIGKKAGHMTAGPVLVLIKDNLKTGERENKSIILQDLPHIFHSTQGHRWPLIRIHPS